MRKPKPEPGHIASWVDLTPRQRDALAHIVAAWPPGVTMGRAEITLVGDEEEDYDDPSELAVALASLDPTLKVGRNWVVTRIMERLDEVARIPVQSCGDPEMDGPELGHRLVIDRDPERTQLGYRVELAT